ncbi:MAG: hypothetical protein IPG68_11315 [Micrococcales bacterium]|nr:hypothetical protein [Micrococcales bacterium]
MRNPLPTPRPRIARPSAGTNNPGGSSWTPAALLRGSLHRLRAFPGLRDVGVLVAAETPQEYRSYLTPGGSASSEAGLSELADGLLHVRYRVLPA